MAGNEGTADAQDPELQEALRLSMEVDSTGIQSNSTTEVGGTQSRSTVSAGEFAQMFALCLATAVYQQSLSPPVSQGPALMDQPGTEFPLIHLHSSLKKTSSKLKIRRHFTRLPCKFFL